MTARSRLPGLGLLSTPLRQAANVTRMAASAAVGAVAMAENAALSGGGVAFDIGRTVARSTPDPAALTRAAAGMTVEALGGPPLRRSSTNGARRWIEVRGLGGQHAAAIAADVLASVRATPRVRGAFLNRAIARVVVTVDPDGPSAAVLCRVVADAERRTSVAAQSHQPMNLPGDDAVLVGRAAAAAAATAGLGLALSGRLLRLPGLPDLLSVPPALADHVPLVRRQLERRLGPEGTDLLLGVVHATAAALTVSPTAAAAEAATRAMLAVEAVNGRLAWARHEPELADHPWPDDADDVVPVAKPEPSDGRAERYANRAGAAGLGAAALLGALSRNFATTGASALVTMPKPLRASREAFGCALSSGLGARHDALVVAPRALRTLDRVDAVVIDPRALYTDELMVSRVRGVHNSVRAHAWEAARTALDNDGLAPGWHKLSRITGAGRSGEALVSPVRDPFAAAVVTEARKAGRRAVSLDDDGLRSLAQGFDRLQSVDGSTDDAVAQAVASLKADGLTVALLTTPQMRTAHGADVTIGVARGGGPPPWGSDVFVPDLIAAWRVLHAMPAARAATDRGIRVSASSSAIGALMLIPGVVGYGPVSVNLGVVGGLWAGFSAGAKVFRDALPRPEAGHDWHALPVTEVQRLLPRPPDEQHAESSARVVDIAPVRALRDTAGGSWRLARDFIAEMRGDLADPITPILATGAAASALLGSVLDAALVTGVLLTNAALSAEQQLHAERTLRRLLAVQDPLARRRVGPLDAQRTEQVAANRLRPGDIIEVRSGEVVPADARVIHASNVEVDESMLTGESLPVTKQTEPTPGVPLAERASMLYGGATMVAGSALAIVTAVGSSTEMRRALAMAPTKSREIGLQRQLSRITRRVLPWSLTGGGLVGLLSALRGTPLRESVASAVAIIVAAVPEGLPLVVTLAQLAAARRLSGESVLVRNAHSIEALARLDVVCFDKTGTLSQNRLQVKAVRPLGGFTTGQVLDAAVGTAYSRHTHRVEHATDDAVDRAADDPSWREDGWESQTRPSRDAFLPFQSGRPFAAALVGTRLTVKGAPEVLSSALADDDKPLVRMIAEMAAKGLRVLAVAERELSPDQARAAAADPEQFEKLCGAQLIPVGLLGLADTARPSAPALLQELRNRDVGVRLITGDHPVTAAVVANELGLDVTAEQVITGTEWEALSTDQRAKAVTTRLVYARMSPEHKIEVIQTLEQSGLVTAMVGDGANDAAAIRAASVGIGVAARDSDPARIAADVLLLDERIEALLDAIDEGQQLWRRVQSAVSMLLGGNTGEVCFALITSLLTGRSVLNARQMLLVNMLTDALPAAALAVSPQMGTAQVDFDEAVMWRAIGIRGASTTLSATLAWLMASVTGTPRRAATIALIGLVGAQLAQTLADSHGRLVVLTAGGSFVVLAVVVNTPGLSQVFGCTPVGPLGWGQALLATALATGVSAIAPGLLSRASAALGGVVTGADDNAHSLLLDDEDAGAQQEGVDLSQRRREQVDTGRDQGVAADAAREIRHVSRQVDRGDQTGSIE
jgi:cation-transporting ATPase I